MRIKNALANFDDTLEFAGNYKYSSLGAYFSDKHISAPIINMDMYKETCRNKKEFKEFAKNCRDFDESSGKISVLH